MPYPEGKKWRATKMINGKRKSKLCRTKDEAKRWEGKQEESVWVEQEKQTVTLLSLTNAYLDYAQERFSKKTYQEKLRAFRNLGRFVGKDDSIEAIQPKDVLAALRHRAKGSGNEANKDRKNLSAAWEWGKAYLGLPDHNPFKAVKRFAYDARARYVPSEADFWKAYAAAAEEDQAFLLTALHTAARRGELFRLMWPDVDFEGGKIRLSTRKNLEGSLEHAWLPMTSQLQAALLAHRKRGARAMCVFSQEDGSPFTSRQHYMERLCNRAGVKPFGFHAIRHLSASILAQAGVDIPTIQAILRHKSPTTTARYLHSLGIVANVLEGVFTTNKKAPGVVSTRG